MTSKKWLIMFLCSILLVFTGIGIFNVVTDPFGVFGDKVLDWYAFDFTKNPRVAKVAYIDKHHDEFDSYLIGSSSTSSFSTDELNRYMDANFYDMFMYGADMYDVEKTAKYLIENYEVKNLVLNLSMMNAVNYDYENDPMTDALHEKVEGGSKVKFYGKYLFANPNYGVEKLRCYQEDSYLQDYYDVFDVRTGAYDKSLRDVEAVGDMNRFLKEFPVFKDYPKREYGLKEMDACVKSVAEIKALCEEKGIHLNVIFSPLYYENARYFYPQQVQELFAKLAEVTEFWDFSLSQLTTDPRFFYDATHFKNAMGDMALAKMFGDESVYVPEDFGTYITTKNAVQASEKYRRVYKQNEEEYTEKVPILMYHQIEEKGNGALVVSAKQFETQIKALKTAGYTGVSLQQLVDYVEKGTALPEKPVVITFDDGYLSNYEVAYPILKKHQMKATIFVIGNSVGQDNYKETEYSMTPHFNYAQMHEMVDSGWIEVQSHTYDMHRWPKFEGIDVNLDPLTGQETQVSTGMAIVTESAFALTEEEIAECMGPWGPDKTPRDAKIRVKPHFASGGETWVGISPWIVGPQFTKEERLAMGGGWLDGMNMFTVLDAMAKAEQLDKQEIKGVVRTSVIPLIDEEEQIFIDALKEDLDWSKLAIEAGTGKPLFALAYPYGRYSKLSEVITAQEGIRVTLSTKPGNNVLVKGLPQSLRALRRYNVTEDMTPAQLIYKIQN